MTLPFGSDDLVEVPLTNAPLAGVLAQVRFPKELAFAERSVAEAVKKVLAQYPVLRDEQAQVLSLGPGGASMEGETVWRLQDKERRWQVTLAPDFVSIETTTYVSRGDFLDRLAEVVSAVGAQAAIVVYDRIGVRYANRLVGEQLDDLDQLVRPDMAGLAMVPPHAGGYLVHVLSDFAWTFDDGGQLRARWGRLPENAYLDQSVEPVAEPSWILDIDSSVTAPGDFAAQNVREQAERCASRAYQFFRWAAQDALLEASGGTP